MVPNGEEDTTLIGLQTHNGKVKRIPWDTKRVNLDTTAWEALVRAKTGYVFDEDGEVVETAAIAEDGPSGKKEGERTGTGGWGSWIWNRS